MLGTPEYLEYLYRRLAQAGRIWLFLDYDGTLVDFENRPDEIRPEVEVIQLLTRLAKHSRIRGAVISGRRLSQLQELMPIPGIWLAGVYEIELQRPRTGSASNARSPERYGRFWMHSNRDGQI
jgi:trehalose-phosphatase